MCGPKLLISGGTLPVGNVQGMAGRLLRVVNLGVRETQPPVEVRRIQTINVVALLAIFFNGLYNILYALIDISELWFVISTNSISIASAAVVVVLNSRGRTNAAMWLLLVGTFFNLIFASLLLGLGTGVFLFLIVIPATGVLMTPQNAWGTQLLGVGGGMVAFLAVVLADPVTPEPIAGTAVETGLLVLSVTGVVLMVSVVGLYFKRLADTAEAELLVANEQSERLLLNVLPEEIADRLKAGEAVIADRAEAVTILFGDLVGSTSLAERLTPNRMVEVLNEIFTPFDDLADDLGLEKIKTIGDAYMVVGGLPVTRPDHVEAVADMALAMRVELSRHSVEGFGPLQMRYGIHTGSVVAGVIGKRKFSYDLWGDTVNTAARMESHGVPGEIQVTEAVYRRLKDRYRFAIRGPVEIKGKGVLETYFLKARNDDPPQEAAHITVEQAT
jgi:class 3 adenylate cyclase